MAQFQRAGLGVLILLSLAGGLFAQRRGTIDMRNQPAPILRVHTEADDQPEVLIFQTDQPESEKTHYACGHLHSVDFTHRHNWPCLGRGTV